MADIAQHTTSWVSEFGDARDGSLASRASCTVHLPPDSLLAGSAGDGIDYAMSRDGIEAGDFPDELGEDFTGDFAGHDYDEPTRSQQSMAASYGLRGHSRQPSFAGSQAKFSRTSLANPLRSNGSMKQNCLLTEIDDEHLEDAESLKLFARLRERLPQDVACDVASSSRSNESDSECDTDLEDEQEATSSDLHDTSGRLAYTRLCADLGVIPVSYFKRHIEDSHMKMRYHGLGPIGSKAIAKILRSNCHITNLNLTGNWMESTGGLHLAEMLKENEFITELNLSENKLGSVGGYHLSKMLLVNTALRSVDLSDNGFSDNDSFYFSQVLEHNKYLKHLNLSKNEFGEESGIVMGPAISYNDILESIDLSWNELRNTGAIAIAKGIKENIRLKKCNLSWNGFGHVGGIAIGEALQANETLEHLDVSGNRLGMASALQIAKALMTNESIKILEIGNNPLTTMGCISLAKSINESSCSELTLLDISNVPVEFEFKTILREIQKKREDFTAKYGSLLRSGNTAEDIGKRAISASNRNTKMHPLMVLREHLVINDDRIFTILKKYDLGKTMKVSAEDFALALNELGVEYSKDELMTIATKLGADENGNIYYGMLEEMARENQKKEINSPLTSNTSL